MYMIYTATARARRLKFLEQYMNKNKRLKEPRESYLTMTELESRVATWTKSYANLPERYLLRKTMRAKYLSPPHPTAFRQSIKLTKIPQHTMIRPWTQEYWKRESPWKNYHNTMAQPIRDDVELGCC